MFQPKAIICDWDHTLCGTFEHALEKMYRAGAEEGFEIDPGVERRTLEYWGKPLPELLRLVYHARGDQVERMCRFFHIYDVKTNPPELIKGVRPVLEAYYAQGVHLTVLSSREHDSLEFLMKRCGVDHLFTHVVSKTMVRNHKPHPDSFACTHVKLTDLNVGLNECLLVGDAMADFETGQNIGVTTVIAKSGAFSVLPLAPEIDERNTIKSFADLPKWLVEHERLAA